MNMQQVLFVGGPWPKFSSVQIRCVDIASYLGCKYAINVRSLADIPEGYGAYICVKPRLGAPELMQLSQRGAVIWDIIDGLPEAPGAVHRYIASTGIVQDTFRHLGPIDVIHHYHCNVEEQTMTADRKAAGWIGNIHWYPAELTVPHEAFDVMGKSRLEVSAAYRRTGVGLNLRAHRNGYQTHARLNSGIKLINCIGFGIPSVSEGEPPYHELAPDCTLFTDLEHHGAAVRRLVNDHDYYSELRANCLRAARRFHISTVADRYRALVDAL